MPKQYFSREFGDSAFKTIITKDSKGNETGHVSAEIVDELTFQADDGSYVSADPSTGEVLISSDTRWADETDGEQIKFYKDRNSFGKMETGTLALIKGQGVFYKDNTGDPKHIAPGFVTGQTFPEHATVGTLFLSSNNQLFLCVGQDTQSNKPNWLKLGTSTVSTGSNLIWNESGAHMTSVADNNNYYAGSNVEDILNELATRLPLYFTQREIGTGDNEISYGHLVEVPGNGKTGTGSWNNFDWKQYNTYIDEIYNKSTGDYYINRLEHGVKIGRSTKEGTEKLIVNGKQLDLDVIQNEYLGENGINPNEFTMYVKHNTGNGYQIDQLATKQYAHFLLSKIPQTKWMVETTLDPDMNNLPYDLWTEYGYYIDDETPPTWFSAKDAGNGNPDNPIQSDGSILTGAKPVYTRTHYNFSTERDKPNNYVYLFTENGERKYQSLLPHVWSNNPSDSERTDNVPPLNEAIRRYIMGERYATNNSFYMDVNNKDNKAGMEIFSGVKQTLEDGLDWIVDKRNVFHANDDYVDIGDPKRYLQHSYIRAKDIKIYGDSVDFGTNHVKIGGTGGKGTLTITGNLEMQGKMTNNSDLIFNIAGADKGSGDKSTAVVKFMSDDMQVAGSLIADAKNKYQTDDEKYQNYQSNLFLNEDMKWYHYNSFGRFGLRDERLGEYILVRESTYDFNKDNPNLDGTIKKVDELNKRIAENNKIYNNEKESADKRQKAKEQIDADTKEKNQLLRTQERALMTTLGGTGQTMIKSRNSAVVLRSDAKSGPKVVASAPQGDVFSVRSGKGGVIQFGFNEDVKNYSSTAYNVGGINYIDSRGGTGKYTDQQDLAFISSTEYHNARNGIFQFENGQQWNDNFIAIGATPKKTSWTTKEKNGKNITHFKNYGDSTLDGHLRLYSCTKPLGNKNEYNAAINNYARIDFDINTNQINFKYVDERLKDYAKTTNANVNAGGYNVNGVQVISNDTAILTNRIFITPSTEKDSLDSKNNVNLVEYIKKLEDRIQALEKNK